MDWKVPITIVILAFIVSLGMLPFFSSEFSGTIGDILSSFKNLFGNLPIIFEKEKKFNGSIEFSLSTENFNNLLKINIPSNIQINVDEEYNLKIDEKKIILRDDFNIYNFTGAVSFKDFLISGECLKISTKNFEMEGKSKIVILEKNFKAMKIENLKIGELILDSGKIRIENPQKINAELNNKIRLYGFTGNLIFKNNTVTLEGNCTRIESENFSFG